MGMYPGFYARCVTQVALRILRTFEYHTTIIEAQASMYTLASNGYRSISTAPQKVYVCLCCKEKLHPGYNAAARVGSERAFFGEALTAAANEIRQQQH
jgi:hypothetical protein